MSAGHFRLISVLWAPLLGLTLLGGLTQWVAAELAYSTRLGAPMIELLGWPVYAPWQLFRWWFRFYTVVPEVFQVVAAVMVGTGAVAVLGRLLVSVCGEQADQALTTYGSARWAKRADIERAGLLSTDGVFIGQVPGHYLRHAGPEHVMAFAPTRSGKGVGLVVPTLLTWTGSTVIHDISGENWRLTAGWRARFSHCLLFNPTDPRSAAYNPLLEVRRGRHEVRDVQNIADILVDPEGALDRRNHWEKTSHTLLVGAILHVLYAETDKTLHGVACCLSDPALSFEQTLERMLHTLHLGDQPHPLVASVARELLNKCDNERSGVLSTALSYLALYRDPTVAAVTSRCDWRIADLVDAAHPVSLYLVVPPSDISRTKPLIRLLLNQIGRRLTEPLDGEAGTARRHQVLLMLDEFPALGRLDFFETALAFMAGYGVRAYLIAQSLNQIDKAYGAHNAILDNCHVRITFASNDERTARRISEALGTATEQRLQRNYGGHRLAAWLPHVSQSEQASARPLLTPGEVMQLPDDQALILIAGQPPIRAGKIRYYLDRHFIARLRSPPSLSNATYVDRPQARRDDWSCLAIPGAVSSAVAAMHTDDDLLLLDEGD